MVESTKFEPMKPAPPVTRSMERNFTGLRRGKSLPCDRACAHRKIRLRSARATQRGGVLRGNDEGSFAVPGELRNAAGCSSHAGKSGEHCLQQGLRHAFVCVRWKRKDIERLQPRQHVPLVAGKPRPSAQAVALIHARLKPLAHRAVADDY